PVGEGEIRGDQQRGVFVELADQVEQELAAGLAEWQVAQLVDDDQMIAQQLLCQPAAAAGGLLLLKLIDQIDEIEEAASGAGTDDRGGHGDAQVGLPGAGAADEDAVALGVKEGAGGQLTDLTLIDRRIGEDEAVDVLQDRELGAADPVADRAGLAVGALGLDQAGEE